MSRYLPSFPQDCNMCLSISVTMLASASSFPVISLCKQPLPEAPTNGSRNFIRSCASLAESFFLIVQFSVPSDPILSALNVIVNNVIFRDVTSCSAGARYQRFTGTCRFHLHRTLKYFISQSRGFSPYSSCIDENGVTASSFMFAVSVVVKLLD